MLALNLLVNYLTLKVNAYIACIQVYIAVGDNRSLEMNA